MYPTKIIKNGLIQCFRCKQWKKCKDKSWCDECRSRYRKDYYRNRQDVFSSAEKEVEAQKQATRILDHVRQKALVKT